MSKQFYGRDMKTAVDAVAEIKTEPKKQQMLQEWQLCRMKHIEAALKEQKAADNFSERIALLSVKKF